MYGDYWQLLRLPFENSCDPLFFFRGRSHEAALLKLQYVVEQSKGIAALVGEHGSGKTYLSRVLEAELESVALSNTNGEVAIAPIIRLMFPRLSPEDMLRYLLNGLTGSNASTSATGDQLISSLEDTLRHHAELNHRPIFIIDDAQLIESLAVWQMLAQVIGLCEVQGLPLCLVLLGQPELLPQLQRVPALSSRIAVRTALLPFDAEETAAYVQHRLTVAGLNECMFDDQALSRIHQLSLGFPRRINQLCDLALLVGYADELPSLGNTDVEAAAEELTTVTTD